MAMPLSEERPSVFILAAHFLHAIVVSVDFMTFQTWNMRMLRRSSLVLRLVALSIIRFYGIDRYKFLLWILSRNYFGISILGV